MKKILTLVLCWLLAFSAMAENTIKAYSSASVAGGYVTSLNKVDGSFEDGSTQWSASVGTIVPTASTEFQGNNVGVWSGTGAGTLDLQWTATASNTYEASAQVDVQGEDDVYICAYVGTTETGCKLIPALSKIQKVSVVADSVMSSAFYLRLKHTESDAFSVKVDDGKIEPWTQQVVNLVEKQTARHYGTGLLATTGVIRFPSTQINSTTGRLFSYDSSNGRITALKNIKLSSSSTLVLASGAIYFARINGSAFATSNSPSGSGGYHANLSFSEVDLPAGSYIDFYTSTTIADNSNQFLTITASAISENVVQSVQSKENVFSAKFVDSPVALLSKSSDWITSFADAGSGALTIDYTKLGLTSAPAVSCTYNNGSGTYAERICWTGIPTNTSVTIYTALSAAMTDAPLTVILQKQYPDYKDPTNLLLALPNGTETNYSITATGNAAQVITANVTDIPFIATTQNNLVWSGSSFTSPTDSIYQVSASINLSANTGNAFEYYINGSRVGRLYSQATGVSSIFPFSTTIAVPANSTFSIRATVNATLSNTADHRLQITRVNGKIDKTFVGNVQPEWQYDLAVTGFTSVTRAVGVVYKMASGQYRMRFNIAGSVPSGSRQTFSVTIAGVTFKNTSGFYQAIAAFADTGTFVQALANPNAATLSYQHSLATTSLYGFSGDVELESKPTWAVNTP